MSQPPPYPGHPHGVPLAQAVYQALGAPATPARSSPAPQHSTQTQPHRPQKLRNDPVEDELLHQVISVDVKAGNTELLRKRRYYPSLESGVHSDMTVRDRDGIEWKVHKVIVTRDCEFFANALKGDFKESQTNVVEMPNDEPAAIKALLEYLYVDDYSITEDAPSKSKPLMIHLDVYIIGQVYGVSGLQKLAYQRFTRLWFKTSCPGVAIHMAARKIYSSTPTSEQRMRKFLSKIATVHLPSLFIDKKFAEVVAEFEDFGTDISKALIENDAKYTTKRYECVSCQKARERSAS